MTHLASIGRVRSNGYPFEIKYDFVSRPCMMPRIEESKTARVGINDDKIESCRLRDRQVGRLLAFEDTAGIDADHRRLA